jgi:predicted dehydrogenase
MEPIVFNIVGGGWRSEFYLQIAKALPERFQIGGMLVRDEAKGEVLERKWNVKTFRTLDDLLRSTQSSFAVVSVSKPMAPIMTKALAERGVPVLTETPPAQDVEGLAELYQLVKSGAKIQVAEQYQFQPLHAARFHLAGSGKLGNVSHVQISVCHEYHAISLMRKLLNIGFANATIRASSFSAPIVRSPNHLGELPPQEEVDSSEQVIAHLDFDGKSGLYDFTYDQYFSWIRPLRLLVRGDRGEINDLNLKYLKDFRTPIDMPLTRQDAGHYGNLEGWHHKGILAGDEWIYQNPFAPGRLSDDEIAIAACLQKMDQYVKGGPEFYSLADGAQDQYVSLMINEAVKTGKTIKTQTQPWAGKA